MDRNFIGCESHKQEFIRWLRLGKGTCLVRTQSHGQGKRTFIDDCCAKAGSKQGRLFLSIVFDASLLTSTMLEEEVLPALKNRVIVPNRFLWKVLPVVVIHHAHLITAADMLSALVKLSTTANRLVMTMTAYSPLQTRIRFTQTIDLPPPTTATIVAICESLEEKVPLAASQLARGESVNVEAMLKDINTKRLLESDEKVARKKHKGASTHIVSDAADEVCHTSIFKSVRSFANARCSEESLHAMMDAHGEYAMMNAIQRNIVPDEPICSRSDKLFDLLAHFSDMDVLPRSYAVPVLSRIPTVGVITKNRVELDKKDRIQDDKWRAARHCRRVFGTDYYEILSHVTEPLQLQTSEPVMLDALREMRAALLGTSSTR